LPPDRALDGTVAHWRRAASGNTGSAVSASPGTWSDRGSARTETGGAPTGVRASMRPRLDGRDDGLYSDRRAAPPCGYAGRSGYGVLHADRANSHTGGPFASRVDASRRPSPDGLRPPRGAGPAGSDTRTLIG